MRAIARLGGPTHAGVPFTLDEEGVDSSILHQDQGDLPSDRVPFRECPIIVHFLAGHRETPNRRHRRAGSTADDIT